MINPAKLFKIKSDWEMFSKSHPKFVNFLNAIGKDGVEVGTVIEMNVTMPDGRKMSSNIKVTDSDVDIFNDIKEITKS